MSEKKIVRYLVITLIFLVNLAFAEGHLPDDTLLNASFKKLSKSSRRKLHFYLLKVIADRSLETTYDIKKIKKDGLVQSSPSRLENLLEIVTTQAYAQEHPSPLLCHFGGWLSTLDASNECQSPWKRAVRNRTDLMVFGPTYTSDYSCGDALLFRCNPILYGPSKMGDPKGEYVETNDSETAEASADCFESFKNDPERVEAFFNELPNNPEKLSQYLGVVAETLRFCEEKNDLFSFCSEVGEFFKERTQALMSCVDQETLYNFLPGIVVPFNQDELDEIAHNLGGNFSSYFEDLRQREQEIREENLRLYEQGFELFSQDPRTQAINQRMRDNVTRCLLGTCVGTKPASKSKEKCARYVKLGFFPVSGGITYADQSKPWNEQYPWSTDAVESGPWLEEMGYENAMDIPELAYLTPENAPVGAVIVYEDTTPERNYNVNGEIIGGPGHIEIKTAEGEYISDFTNDNPTRIGGARVPIGIYIQIPDQIKSQITAMPGS